MDRQKRFRTFDLDDQVTAYKQINSIATIQQNVLVTHREWHLHLNRDLALR